VVAVVRVEVKVSWRVVVRVGLVGREVWVVEG
jgi:hypothetical protein